MLALVNTCATQKPRVTSSLLVSAVRPLGVLSEERNRRARLTTLLVSLADSSQAATEQQSRCSAHQSARKLCAYRVVQSRRSPVATIWRRKRWRRRKTQYGATRTTPKLSGAYITRIANSIGPEPRAIGFIVPSRSTIANWKRILTLITISDLPPRKRVRGFLRVKRGTLS